ncbi:MAG: hypothetical protein MUF64_21215 [Polyangiaceae bacterium]|jgi:hypothetical protein|nr:hypothetical protein [Polyangiaceae bacterium]
MANAALPVELLRQIKTLSSQQKLKLVEHVARDLASEHLPTEAPRSLIGVLAAQGELLDEIAESAMQTRERDPLRRPDA